LGAAIAEFAAAPAGVRIEITRKDVRRAVDRKSNPNTCISLCAGAPCRIGWASVIAVAV
jgi:hypothetical protein